jgi:hypothetical protein
MRCWPALARLWQIRRESSTFEATGVGTVNFVGFCFRQKSQLVHSPCSLQVRLGVLHRPPQPGNSRYFFNLQTEHP